MLFRDYDTPCFFHIYLPDDAMIRAAQRASYALRLSLLSPLLSDAEAFARAVICCHAACC